MDTAYKGSLYLKDKLITGSSHKHLARLRNEYIGFVFQFHYLLLEFSVLDNVMLPALKLGLKSDEDLRIAFESGAEQITGGNIAVKKREIFETWLKKYGSDKIILGADAKNEKIATNGWLETSELDLLPFVKAYNQKGIDYVICTDISKDGMLTGPSIDLYKKIIKNIPGIKLIASGGVSKFDELPELQAIGCEGTIIGKAIYENKISLKQLENYILSNN